MRHSYPPQAPRVTYPLPTNPYSRPTRDADELQRLNSRLKKANTDLDVERKRNAELRITTETTARASVSAAMSDILANLLQKQAHALSAKAALEEKQRDLLHREQTITNLEMYLADGQAQLKYKLEQQGIRLMSVVEVAKLRREVELEVKRRFAEVEGRIEIQVERLQLQDAAQRVREQVYEQVVRGEVEAELRTRLADDKEAQRTAGDVVTEVKQTERTETKLSDDFLKGYAAYHRSHTALNNLRNGTLPPKSPELAFLFDPTHAEHPLAIGQAIGQAIGHLDAETSTRSPNQDPAISEPQPRTATVNTAYPASVPNNKHTPLTPPAVPAPQMFQRPTFASELRASTIKPIPTSTTTSASISPTNKSPRVPSRGQEGTVYAGRKVVRYGEDSDSDSDRKDARTEAKSMGREDGVVSLIDLY